MKLAVHVCIAFALASGSLQAAEPGALVRETELKSEPFIDAAVVTRLTRDLRVEILHRDGGWMEVSAGRHRGWLRAVNVRREGAAPGAIAQSPVLALESGRAAAKDLVTTTGIRSARVANAGAAVLPPLDDEALKKVGADDGALKSIEAFGASAEDARKFAGEVKLSSREVPFIPGSQPRPFLRGVEPTTPSESESSRQIAARLLGAIPLVHSDALQTYVNRVGSWVAQQATGAQAASAPKWVFGVLDSAAPRTFTIPGNYIFITRGLYERLQNESELAALLGREIGHILKGTYLAAMEKKYAVLSYLPHASTEAEADRIGVVLATRAGYDAYGLPILLENLAQQSPGRAGPSPDPLAERRASLERAMGTQFESYSEGKTLGGRLVRAGA